jgi:CheY-like chemotaxis protein
VTTTLLAIDDSVTMRKVLEITFAGENYKTVLASSADEALNAARSERPAIALIDHTLADMSGYDLARELKAVVPGLAVMILSSKQNPFDKARAAATGVDDFMDKPFDTQKLLDKVGQVLAAPRAAQPAPAAAAAAPPPAAPAPAPVAAMPVAQAKPRSQTLSYGTPAGAPAQPAPSPQPAPVANPTRGTGTLTGTPAATPRPASVQQPPVRAPEPAPAPARPAAPAAVAAAVAAGNGQLSGKLEALGLTPAQVDGVLALSREVVERVVWEVVPVLAETIIKEEIQRLTS